MTWKCPRCGCTELVRCGRIRISDDGEEYGTCGPVPGHELCAACLQPGRGIPGRIFASPVSLQASEHSQGERRRHRPWCRLCGNQAPLYNAAYDAHFCERCVLWLDEKCTNANCDACRYRPPRPLRVTNLNAK